MNLQHAVVVAVLRAETIKAFGEEHWPAMEQIVGHESGFRPTAQNPTSTAFGLFQFLDSTWASYGCKKTAVVSEQIRCGIKYISARYKDPNRALLFWNLHRWY
mgnify:CR=1 FL=1